MAIVAALFFIFIIVVVHYSSGDCTSTQQQTSMASQPQELWAKTRKGKLMGRDFNSPKESRDVVLILVAGFLAYAGTNWTLKALQTCETSPPVVSGETVATSTTCKIGIAGH